MSNIEDLKFKKYSVLDNGFICLVDAMGDDSSIVQAAKVSFGKDVFDDSHPDAPSTDFAKKRQLIRYLMAHNHTTPFEMVEIKFMVQVPMDCWRQWIRHRTANVNEYSTRYTEAIDMCQTTDPTQWRLQATDNKQGSSGFLTEWPEDKSEQYQDRLMQEFGCPSYVMGPGNYLSWREELHHKNSSELYRLRLDLGVAKEQARKDLPLSTYTRAYWKCDLHNIFNFLRLRMDSHAQYEIRMYANAMYEIVKQIVPVACEAFEDYVLNACRFSAMEMKIIREAMSVQLYVYDESMSQREWKEFVKKVST
jgi:thymidylate synthase (FAD)